MIYHPRLKKSVYNRRGAAFGAGLAILLSLPPLTELGGTVGTAFARQPEPRSGLQSEDDSRPLEAGKPIEREMAGGQKHYYKIALEAGQYLHLIVDQRGIDVVVTLFGPNDKRIIRVDSPANVARGLEPVFAIAEASGTYRLEVRSLNKDASAGRYEVKIANLRTATLQDRNRVPAEIAFAEGMELESQGMAESLRKAIAKYEEAIGLFRVAGASQGEGASLYHIGLIYGLLGDGRKALDYFNQSLPLRRAAGDRSGEAETLDLIGQAYIMLGEKRKALDYFDQALPLRVAVGNRGREAVTLHNIGYIYASLGETQKALDYYHQALSLRRAVGDRRGEAVTLTSIGAVYDSLGEKRKALGYYNQSLPLRRTVGDRRGEANVLNHIGDVYDSLGEKQKALGYYNQALTLSRAVGDRKGEVNALNDIGSIYNSLNEARKALDYYNQTLSLRRAVGYRDGEAVTLNGLGSVYYELGERRKGLDCHNQALSFARAVGDPRSEATALFGIAKIEAAEGKLFDARSTIETALNIIESLRTKVVSPELRSSYFETAKNYYEFSISLLMRLHKLRPDEGYDRAALQAVERARARSLLERLAEMRLKIRRGADPALVERERELRQLLNAKTERHMRLLNGKHTAEQAAEVENEIKSLTAQYQDAEAEIRAKSPRYAALTQPRPLSPEEIQRQALDDRTLLLEYFLGEERSYLWAVSASRVKSYELPKRADIEEVALLVKKLLTARATLEKGESPERRRARITEAEARYWPEAARLSRMILGPAISELGGKRLAIVPDGELQDVAFGALPTPQSSGPVKINGIGSRSDNWLPLIVRHSIVSLPSASALAVLRKETAGRKPAAKSVAVLADPVFDKDDERIKLAVGDKPGKESGSEANASANGDLMRATEEVMVARGDISRLPFSRAEAEAILSVAPKAGALRALDFNASRATATSAELSQYQIVHFATHGLLNRTHPELSGVVLSLVDRQGKPQDGFLQLHDVYNLDLPAELVVLSACQTGQGKAIWGEGLVGLTRGFMYAGARRVVASLWGVQDLATAELMKRFYGAMLGEKQMRPAEALRAAQVEMWKHRRWRSPYYWGGFAMYGEW
jgi:CHAT domain-containing protein